MKRKDKISVCGILGMLADDKSQAIMPKRELNRLIGELRKEYLNMKE